MGNLYISQQLYRTYSYRYCGKYSISIQCRIIFGKSLEILKCTADNLMIFWVRIVWEYLT
jgi:hypothetical protein